MRRMWISRTYLDGLPFRFPAPPDGVAVDSRVLRTADLREVRALYWAPTGTRPKTAVVAMHPRVDFTQHYTFPALLERGYGCLGALSRNLGDDTDTVHEDLVLDVAACVRWLREEAGAERVVLLGNSGGGSLMGLYQSLAEQAPEARPARTPGGRRAFLQQAPLPPGDGLVLLAAHRGQGHVLLRSIDPSVTDEADPLSVDPALDLYDPANGFRPSPAWTTYDSAFLERYAEAQAARVARLDATARAHLDDRRAHRGTRRGHLARVMVVYRTSACPATVDRGIDPSNRDYGTLLTEQPEVQNYERLGFARVVTPEGWLSTWSAHSSRADLGQTLPGVSVPVLVVHAGADREVFVQADLGAISAALAAEDRTVVTIDDGRHYFEPDGCEARARALRTVGEWIDARWAP
jgi:alpha-beta hydrolase superfamily lysophospholipase